MYTLNTLSLYDTDWQRTHPSAGRDRERGQQVPPSLGLSHTGGDFGWLPLIEVGKARDTVRGEMRVSGG